jgi:hypothetical protein
MTYPSYPSGPLPGMGHLVVDCTRHLLVFGMPGVRVEINGQPVKVPWGQSPFELPAGNYDLRVSTRWLGSFAPARLPVAVYPGQVTTVYYRPSTMKWMRGSIGFTPQLRTRGLVAFWAYMAAILVIVPTLILLTR